MNAFKYDKDADGIVTVTMDMTGPVNAMNAEFKVSIRETVARLEAEQDLRGVVLASAKKTFFAGGDLNVLVALKAGNEAQILETINEDRAVLRRLEKLPVPVVAAINGAALGGGYEICMCCKHRIAWDDSAAAVGLPEVTLGLLPGAGTVRIVSLLGLENALPFLLEGKKLSGRKALEAGLIDELVPTLDELVPCAKQWILRNGDNPDATAVPWDRKGYRLPGGGASNPRVMSVLQMAPFMLRQKTRGLLPAPEHILNVAAEATRLDFDTALRVEARNFVHLVTTPEAKNMINAFFFQMGDVNRGASRPRGVPPSKVRKLGVLGAGMMGQGIAYVSALAGIDVVLKDITDEAAQRGKAYGAKLLDQQIAKGRASEAHKHAVLDRILATGRESDLQGCDLIVEAVFEDMALKKQLTASLERQLADGGVWGSNTSTLPISLLAEGSTRPENFIGVHFFSPVDKMSLVEIICGRKTSESTLAKAFDYVRQIGKTPIVVNDALGFFTSRTIGTQLSEAAQLVAEGVHPVRIESLARAIGMPAGPLTVHDEVSQKLSLAAASTQVAMGLLDLKDDPAPAGTALLRELVAQHGRGGRQHGGGYYDYTEQGKRIWPKLVELYHKPGLEISDQDVKDRLLFRPVIESLKCLDEGVLRSVADGNIGSLLGIGAPTWTGGYIQFVNTYGPDRFVKRCEALADKYGARFQPPAVARKHAASSQPFT